MLWRKGKKFSKNIIFAKMTNIDLLQIGHERHGDARMMVKLNVSDNPHVELPSAHRHRFYAVYWIHEGQGLHSIDFCDYEILPDRVFFVRPDQVHFMQLINSRILLEIKRQLLENEKTVSEIAFSVGFDELSYFSRFFRRMEGISPVEFRERMNKMYQR